MMPHLGPQAEGELLSYFCKSDFSPQDFYLPKMIRFAYNKKLKLYKIQVLILLPNLGPLHYVVQERAWGTKAPSNYKKKLCKNSPFYAFGIILITHL